MNKEIEKKARMIFSLNVTIIYLYRGSVCGKGEIIIFNIQTCATENGVFFILCYPVLCNDLHVWIWFIYHVLL